MNNTIRAVYKHLKEISQPALMKRLQPRIYTDQPGYIPNSQLAVLLAGISIQLDGIANPTEPDDMAMLAIKSLVVDGVPTRWIHRDMFQALIKTKLPDSIHCRHIKAPLRSLMLVLPDGLIPCVDADGDECEVKALLCTFVPSHAHPSRLDHISVYCLTVMKENGLLGSLMGMLINMQEDWSMRELAKLIKIEHAGMQNVEHFTTAAHLVLSMVTMLNARPQFMGEPTQHKPIHSNGPLPGNPPWKMTFIGGAYRTPKAPYAGGTHNSPRLHWRMGHCRLQPYKDREVIIWIEPTLVNEPELV